MKEGNTRLESKWTESFQSDDSCKIPTCGFCLLEHNLFPCLTKHDDKDRQASHDSLKIKTLTMSCATLSKSNHDGKYIYPDWEQLYSQREHEKWCKPWQSASVSVAICQRFRFVGEGSISKVAPSTKEVNLGDVISRCFQESSFWMKLHHLVQLPWRRNCTAFTKYRSSSRSWTLSDTNLR